MQSSWRRGFAGLVLLFGLVVLAPFAQGQVSLPLEGKGSEAGNSGAFSYSIPIEVPPGRHGLAPQLSLTYNSSQGNGFLGVGWDLPTGYVMRSTKYGVDYGCVASSTGNPCYVFMLGGASSELIPRPDLCSSNCYGARIESGFIQFQLISGANGSYWQAIDKNGTKYLFGQSTASRQDGTPGTFKWMLDTLTDTQTQPNIVSYSYAKDQGEIYIDHIDYQAIHIAFVPDPNGRTDIEKKYIPNFAVITARRLGSIQVQANGTLVRTYTLGYCGTTGVICAASNTGRSILGKVTQSGSDGTTLPAITFGWQTAGNGTFNFWSKPTTLGPGNAMAEYFADVNGDGKADVIQVSQSSNVACVGLANGDGTFGIPTNSNWTYCTNSLGPGNSMAQYFADVNGDGRADVIQVSRTSNVACVGLANADGTFGIPTNSNWTYCTNSLGPINSSGFVEYFADVNGDGRADVIQVSQSSNVACVGLANGDGTFGIPTNSNWTYCTNSLGPINSNSGSFMVYFADVNGDGRADVIQVSQSSNLACVGLANGDGTFGIATNSNWTYCTNSPGALNNNAHYFADVTGDGRADWIQVAQATGNGWVALPTGLFPDLLTLVLNGIGGQTTVTYQSSSYFFNSTDTRWNLPFITQNVSSITACDNYNGSTCVGNSSTTNYNYSGAYYNAAAREFRDFYSVTATTVASIPANNVTTQTLYHQGNGNIDNVNNVITATADNASDSVGYLAGQPFQVTVTDSTGAVRSQKTLTYWPDIDGAAPYFTPVKQVDNAVYETPSVSKTSRNLTTFDDRFSNYSGVFGNLTKEETWFDLNGNPSDYRQVQRGFVPNTSPWIVGLPSYEKVFDTSGATTLKGLTVYHYDTVGNLTQIGRWYDRGTGTGCDGLVSSGSCIATSMVYDGYGNVTSITDAKSHMTSTCYDANGTFPQKVTNAKSQVVLTDYYGVGWNSACGSAPAAYTGAGLYGQVKSVTDPNGQQATTTYDPFGRKSQITFPDGSWTSYAYNSFGSVGSQNVQTNTAIGLSSWTYFDGLGRTITEKNSGADSKVIRVDTAYNNLGQITSVTLPYFDGSANNGWTVYSYDIIGRPSQITYADGSRTLLCSNLWDLGSIDANNHLKRERKDGHGRITEPTIK